MTRLNKILCAEYDRKVRFESKRFHGTEKWLPYEFNGADTVNIYWYPETKGKGPYLRFFDNTYEYLVDLKNGKTFLMQREDDDKSCSVGELLSNKSKQRWTTDEATGDMVNTIDGHPVRTLDPAIASNPGTYIGRVGWSSDQFVPKKEAPEEYIKTIY
jgi:hypothetical protein